MTDEVDLTVLRQYEDIFGPVKMSGLWHEYLDKAEKDLQTVDSRNREELRLLYHSLRSSSRVFGMTAFAALCEQIETAIVEGRPDTEICPLIKEGHILFAAAVKAVNPHFDGENGNE